MSENWSKIKPRGTPKNKKNEHRKTVNKCMKKGAAGCAGAAGKMVGGGGGSPYRTAPQDKKYKLTRAH